MCQSVFPYYVILNFNLKKERDRERIYIECRKNGMHCKTLQKQFGCANDCLNSIFYVYFNVSGW